MVSVAVIGARGYLGRECVRLLLAHPHVDTILPVSLSQADGTLGDTLPAFRGIDGLDLRDIQDPQVREADVILFATAAGEAKTLAPTFDASQVLIDLSRDHRLVALRPALALLASGATASPADAAAGQWSFGLAESPLAVPQGTTRIANPGCYPTAALLGMLPALTNGLVANGPIIVDGKSGISGAGATPRADLHFPEANDDVRAYKVIGHDHTEEMRLAAAHLGAWDDAHHPVRFTPHLIPITRGLLTTVYLPIKAGTDAADIAAAYAHAYAGTPTVRLTDEARLANVRGTARADVAWSYDDECHLLVVRTAIDNLLKGGSAQAIQNMNRALGLPEPTALPLIAAP